MGAGEMNTPPVAHPSQCSYPQREGNRVYPLIDGEETFSAIFEAIDHAQSAVWVAVSFFHNEFQIVRQDGGTDSFWSVLERARQRGVDVRVLFWSHDQSNPLFSHSWRPTDENLTGLKNQHIGVRIRWDSSGDDLYHCHHEKSWVVDPGLPQQRAYVGGIIISNRWAVGPDHAGVNGPGNHDVVLGIEGPAAGDVAQSFVQRWNGAWRCQQPGRSYPPGIGGEEFDLPPLSLVDAPPPESVSTCAVQIHRNIRPRCYPSLSAPGCEESFDMISGEGSIALGYAAAIQQAQHTIYIENQHLAHAPTIELLCQALERGVEVIAVVPGVRLEQHMKHWMAPWVHAGLGWMTGRCLEGFARSYSWWQGGSTPLTHQWEQPFLHSLPRLQQYRNFTLVGLLLERPSGLHSLYVHSKLLVVDDEFLTAGSANMVHLSFDCDHTEVNAAVWSADVAQEMRERLFSEHMGIPREQLPSSTQEQFSQFRALAHENAKRIRKRQSLHGRVHAMDARSYGVLLYGLANWIDHRAGPPSLPE